MIMIRITITVIAIMKRISVVLIRIVTVVITMMIIGTIGIGHSDSRLDIPSGGGV